MTRLLLPLILGLGAILRFYHNTAVSLWHDEAFSALYLTYDWGEMMHRIGLDVHPPLYYLILRLWSYFAGTGLLSLRLLSIAFGVLTIWAAYALVKAAFRDDKLALVASLFIALSPFQIQYALEARMYTLGTFLTLWSSYFLIRALENKKFWLPYALTAAAGLYTHYYLIFVIAAQALYLLLHALRHKNLKTLLYAAGAYLFSALLYLPWIPVFLAQASRVQENFWVPPLEVWSIPGTIWKMAFGGEGAGRPALLATAALALLLLVYYLRREKKFHKWLMAAGLLTPFAGAVALSIMTDLYLDRYFVFTALFFSVVAAGAFYRLPWPRWRSLLIVAFVAASVFAFFKNWAVLDLKGKPGMAGAAAVINQEADERDAIFVGSSFVFFTFKYYNRTEISPLLYSTATLENIPHFSGTALLTEQDLIQNLARTPQDSKVWFLWTTGFGSAKPGVPPNWKETGERGFQDVPGFKGWVVVTEYLVE